MLQHVLIPTDFSVNSWNAIEYALSLFKDHKCTFYFLHTYIHPGSAKDSFFSSEPTDKELQELDYKVTNEMEEFKNQIINKTGNTLHTFHFLNEYGSFYEVLQRIVNSKNIQLIVMGTKGKTDSTTSILGSNTVNVMEKIRNCPTLGIPADLKYKAPNEIVFPTSFRTSYRQKEIQLLKEISKLTQAPIRVLHVQNRPKMIESRLKNKKVLDDYLQSSNYSHHTLFNIDLRTAVQAFVQSRESEMIAFVNKRHKFFESIFSNPLVKELGMHTRIPLLAMHDRED